MNIGMDHSCEELHVPLVNHSLYDRRGSAIKQTKEEPPGDEANEEEKDKEGESCDIDANVDADADDQRPVVRLLEERSEGENCRMPSLLTNCILYLLGIGLLVPWNAFVSAKPYFSARLCGEVELWFGLAYNISGVVSLGALLMANWFCASHQRSSSSTRSIYWMVMAPLSIYLAVFAITAILVFVPSVPRQSFFIVTLLSIGTCGSMVAIASAGMVATASKLGGVGPLFSGQALGGVVVAIVNFASSWLGESIDEFWDRTCSKGHRVLELDMDADCALIDHVDWAVVSYFGVGCMLLSACLVGYHFLFMASDQPEYQPVEDVNLSVESSPRFVADLELDREQYPPDNLTIIVWKKVNQPALAIFFNLMVTLAIFPAWTASLKSTQECISHSRIWNDLFTPLTFVFFNVLDLLGRLLAERYSHCLNHSRLVPLSVSRIILFLPFAMLPTSHVHQSITPIQSDGFSFLVQALFALSNGFVISWSFLVAPTLIPPKNEAIEVRSSEILNLCLNMGLLSGSMLSFLYATIAAS